MLEYVSKPGKPKSIKSNCTIIQGVHPVSYGALGAMTLVKTHLIGVLPLWIMLILLFFIFLRVCNFIAVFKGVLKHLSLLHLVLFRCLGGPFDIKTNNLAL